MDPDRLRGSRTGVYAGISNHDYHSLILSGKEIAEPAASLYAVSGTSFNTAIGRVAFALGLEGPAMDYAFIACQRQRILGVRSV